MSEQRCGTCARWHQWDGTVSGRPSLCLLTGLACAEVVGDDCRAYRTKGQRTVRVRFVVMQDAYGDLVGHSVEANRPREDVLSELRRRIRHGEAPECLGDCNRYSLMQVVEADIPIPETVTVEGVVGA